MLIIPNNNFPPFADGPGRKCELLDTIGGNLDHDVFDGPVDHVHYDNHNIDGQPQVLARLLCMSGGHLDSIGLILRPAASWFFLLGLTLSCSRSHLISDPLAMPLVRPLLHRRVLGRKEGQLGDPCFPFIPSRSRSTGERCTSKMTAPATQQQQPSSLRHNSSVPHVNRRSGIIDSGSMSGNLKLGTLACRQPRQIVQIVIMIMIPID